MMFMTNRSPVALATFFDNSENEGTLLQGHCMLSLFGAHGINFNRNAAANHCPAITPSYYGYSQLSLSDPFSNVEQTVKHINENYSMLVVGSDEIWKCTHDEKKANSVIPHYPNHFFGHGIAIPKIAIAVTFGPYPFRDKPEHVRKAIADDLRQFDLIYVRDNQTLKELEAMKVESQILPDPTFAFNFHSEVDFQIDPNTCYDLKNGKIDGLIFDPISWFVLQGRMTSAIVYRMHSLLACIRGNTPCLILDRRVKTKEVVKTFKLPDSCFGNSIDLVKKEWPYDFVSKTVERHQLKWESVMQDIDKRYGLYEKIHDSQYRRPGSVLSSR